LRALHAAKPFYLRVDALYAVICDDELLCTVHGVRGEMLYLESKNYIDRLGADQWRINAQGVDLVEGTIGPDPGVLIEESR
jgi:hypothetical protein